VGGVTSTAVEVVGTSRDATRSVTNADGLFRYPAAGTLPLGRSSGCADRPIDDGLGAPIPTIDTLQHDATCTAR
jgi:hypothetical protein